jgi:hypothetical protein
MPANPALPILATLLICLFPIAVYCLVLSSVNRREQPLLMRGVSDFAALLFAVSGIILWAGPAMLASLYERSVAEQPQRSFDDVWRQWWLIWAAYYVAVIGGAALLLWLRRQTTAIYNVQPDLVPSLVAATLQRLGFDFAQNAQHQFLIAPAKSLSPAVAAISERPQAPEAPAAAGLDAEAGAHPYTAAVEVEQFSSLCHATLHWYEIEPAVRREIEDELRKQLAGARPFDNPASLWQLGIGLLLIGTMLLAIFFYILTGLVPRW